MDTLIGFESLGERLRVLLKQVGYSQKDANEELGFSPNTLGNYIHGRIPKPEPLYELSKFFKVNMDWLLTGEDTTKYIRDEELQLIQTYRTLHEKQQEKARCYLVGIANAFNGFDKRLHLLIENGGHYNHEELTKNAGLPENSISRYLNGGTPGSRALYQLSKFFEVSMEWLLIGEVIIEGFSEEENQFIQNYRTLKLKEQGEIIGYMNGLLEEWRLNEEVIIKMLQQNVSEDIIKSVIDISDGALEEIKNQLNT